LHGKGDDRLRVVLDENVSLALASRLVLLGCDVALVSERARKGVSDQEIWELVCGEGVVFVTRDRHFLNSKRYPPSMSRGILFISPGNLPAAIETEILVRFLENCEPSDFEGRLVVITPEGFELR
jgi:predicted nuclease of predicted toxin-antitoxin system